MPPTAVWTNVEDEILKAAVSKYGLNQWARVSSLLSRKSAKACKARWSEWIDPSLRKTEWSNEESEKLLHLVKIMPTSWRTIASIIGRSANQCITQYQKLLDEAEKKEDEELGLGGVTGGEADAPVVDPRKPKIGEETMPETLPAIPDAIDLSAEDQEGLSEARARLANTQGKKAKRKMRERDMAESRRVAQLQKRRELKMSGINIRLRTTKKGETDYNADIPFEHNVPRGLYDVDDERVRNEQEKAGFDPKRQQLSNKRKGDQQEDEEDRKRKKMENKSNGPSVSAQAMQAAKLQKRREAERNSMRKALNLPAPQITEGELEEVVKLGRAGERANGSGAAGLGASYSSLPAATPIRTPRAAPEEDRIANELRNIKALNETQSAILGGETPVFSKPSGPVGSSSIVTPNPMATPLRNRASATPWRGQTPRQPTSNKQDLLSKLAALPKPKAIEYELELPDAEIENIAPTSTDKEDASVRDAREQQYRLAAELADFKRQSQVVQRRLPRPAVVDIDALLKQARSITDPIERDVAVETALLIANDAAKFGGAKVTGTTRPLRIFEDADMRKARELIALELSSHDIQKEKQAFTTAWTELHAAKALPGLDGYYEDEIDEHQMMVETFDSLEDRINATAEKGNELEAKLKKVHGGYMNRAKMLRQKISEAAETLEKTRIDVNTALSAQVAEDAAVARRLEQLRDEVGFVSRREREAQEEYRRVREELDSLPATNGYH